MRLNNNGKNKIDEILKAVKNKGSDAEIGIVHDCYVNVRHDEDGYSVSITPHWPNAEDNEELTEEQVREFLGALGIEDQD